MIKKKPKGFAMRCAIQNVEHETYIDLIKIETINLHRTHPSDSSTFSAQPLRQDAFRINNISLLLFHNINTIYPTVILLLSYLKFITDEIKLTCSVNFI